MERRQPVCLASLWRESNHLRGVLFLRIWLRRQCHGQRQLHLVVHQNMHLLEPKYDLQNNLIWFRNFLLWKLPIFICRKIHLCETKWNLLFFACACHFQYYDKYWHFMKRKIAITLNKIYLHTLINKISNK